MEEWKKIQGFNAYSISNLGRVRKDAFEGSTTRTYLKPNGKSRTRVYPLKKKERVLVVQENRYVLLWVSGYYYHQVVNELVAKHFKEAG